MQRIGVITSLTAVMALTNVSAQAAELVMVEEEGCVYCARFNTEKASAYPTTGAARLASSK